MATIINRTKCEDCVHDQLCVKKKDFNNLVKEINDVKITLIDQKDKSMGLVSINSKQFSSRILIECDYFINKEEYSTPKHGVLLCKRNGVEE